MFPNPSQVPFHLDLDEISTADDPEDWRLTLANLWSDLLLRRVADFAASLFQPLQGDSIFVGDQLSSTLLGWIFKVVEFEIDVISMFQIQILKFCHIISFS